MWSNEHNRFPQGMGATEIHLLLGYLAMELWVHAFTQNQALSVLPFLCLQVWAGMWET